MSPLRGLIGRPITVLATVLCSTVAIIALSAFHRQIPLQADDAAETPDCYCKLSWKPFGAWSKNNPKGTTAPDDFDDMGTHKFQVINVELLLTKDSGGCKHDNQTPPVCNVKIRPCRKIVKGELVTAFTKNMDANWNTTNGISETDIEPIDAGPRTTLFSQTLAKKCNDTNTVVAAGFVLAPRNGWAIGDGEWEWEMLCGECGTATGESSGS